MTKKNIMPVVVLTAICVVVAALLGAVNLLTSPIIAERNDAAIQESLEKVMPGGLFNAEPDKLGADAPETVVKAYTEKTGKGTVVVLLTNKGYTGNAIGLTVGIDSDGKITGMVVTQNNESIVPNELKPGGTYGNHYVGAEAQDIPELSTGATVVYTEGAIKNAVTDAFVYLGFAETKPELPREESEIEARAKALYGEGAEKLVSSTPNNREYVKRIYREKGGDAYVAYAFAYSQYGTPEFEFLVYVDENGIVKSVDKLLWKVSDPKPEWGYNPPSEEAVDAFFQSFVGKSASSINSVEVATGATNTANKVKDAAYETLLFAKPTLPRDKAEIDALAKEFYGNGSANLVSYDIEGAEFVKIAYQEPGKKSYVAYAFAISQYGTPEFEFLVYVDENGIVKNVNKILWKVSDAKPEWGYNPPSEEAVDAFFQSFVGKDANEIKSVDVATGVTNTSNKVKNAAYESLKIDIDAKQNYAARIVGISILFIAIATTVTLVIINKKRRAVK